MKKTDGQQVVLKAGDSFAKHIEGTYPAELKGCSLAKLLKGYATGDWEGSTLEQKAMASTPVSAGGIMIPTPLAADVIDLARNATPTSPLLELRNGTRDHASDCE